MYYQFNIQLISIIIIYYKTYENKNYHLWIIFKVTKRYLIHNYNFPPINFLQFLYLQNIKILIYVMQIHNIILI